jgi:hypothetical protein
VSAAHPRRRAAVRNRTDPSWVPRAASRTVPTFNGKGDVDGVMVLDGSNYRYNLDTRGYSTTAGVPGFYQETITVAYKSAPNIVVGSDAIQIDTK